MVPDVKNGGGYGRFTEETKDSATTATQNLKTTLSDKASVAGFSGTNESVDKLRKSLISGSTKLGTNITSQIPGVETAATNVANSTSNLSLKNSEKFQSKVKADLQPPLPNLLSYYTSYNSVFTLSVLSEEAINFPDLTYKKGQLGPIILKSAGGAPDKELVDTAYGKYDFYIDDVKLNGLIGFDRSTGNTNSTTISFRVIEPYSMGLFFQAIQAASKKAGYKNYLDMPILLMIEFKGHVYDNDAQLLNTQIDRTAKHIPLRLISVSMKVTGKGTTYDVVAYPWNEQGFSTSYNQVKTPVNIKMDTGGPYTVQNMLQTGEQSLQKMMNDYFETRVKNKQQEVANQILILFPADLTSDPSNSNGAPNENKEGTATVNSTSSNSGNQTLFKKLGVTAGTGKNTSLVQEVGEKSVNLIGQAKMGFNVLNKGDTPFPKDNAVYDEKTGSYIRGNLTIDYSNSSFKFNQGASVVDMINQVILMSDFGRNALSDAQRSPEGLVNWFRIETQVYTLGADESKKVGTKPKLVVFRVVPYKVDASAVQPINTKRSQLDNLKKQALKEYNYIYTGKNTEILDFNIEFNAGFYTALSADGGKNSEQKELAASTGGAANSQALDDQKRSIISQSVSGESADTQQTPSIVKNDLIESRTGKMGSGGVDDENTKAARQFQDIITNGVDMIGLDLTILGDPYYLGDSGMGNYSAQGVVGYNGITADGSINYQTGEVYVSVNFKTPVDLNQDTGFYNFGDTRPVLQFSGLYRVIEVESNFSRGKFKQVLKMFRLRGQDNPSAPEPTSTSLLASENTSSSLSATNASILNSPIGKGGNLGKNNNVNPSAPNNSLPGVVNSGGFTI
jgi:hypothetical protein